MAFFRRPFIGMPMEKPPARDGSAGGALYSVPASETTVSPNTTARDAGHNLVDKRKSVM
jgi:hypothetical protein